jgi:hypothetical protein
MVSIGYETGWDPELVWTWWRRGRFYHFPCRELNSGHPARTLDTILTELPRFPRLRLPFLLRFGRITQLCKYCLWEGHDVLYFKAGLKELFESCSIYLDVRHSDICAFLCLIRNVTTQVWKHLFTCLNIAFIYVNFPSFRFYTQKSHDFNFWLEISMSNFCAVRCTGLRTVAYSVSCLLIF